jgi:hypothetical protein
MNSEKGAVSFWNSTGGNRENGERKPALFSLFPLVRVLRKTQLRHWKAIKGCH